MLPDGVAWLDGDEGPAVGLKGGRGVTPGSPEEPPGRSSIAGRLDEEASSFVSSILASGLVVLLSCML
jgi:hypothetical protein